MQTVAGKGTIKVFNRFDPNNETPALIEVPFAVGFRMTKLGQVINALEASNKD